MSSRPQPADDTPALAVREVTLGQPLQWLRRGWADLWRCPGPGLLHGAVAMLFGWAVLYFAREDFWIMAGAFSGFLIVAPIVATGLYAISRGLESGQRLGLAGIWRVWRSQDPRLMHFGLLLGLAGTGWVMTSAAMITSFADLPVHRPAEFLRHVVLHETSWVFEAWLMLGGVLAAPVFASSVVAIPLLLDRPVSVLSAVLTSWRVVAASPIPLALWAGLLMTISALGMATAMLGLLVAVPWLAHASWHAYRDLVVPAGQDGQGGG
jgi:uncharacterized membrane protein